MFNRPLFKNRIDGGQKLAARLKNLGLKKPLVLAIPAGGVPVGREMALALGAPLDLMVVRKIKIPHDPEAGFGSVTSDGGVFLNPRITPYLGLKKEEIKKLAQGTVREVKQRERLFRGKKPRPKLENKQVILVDDGLASGFTMLAAASSVKKKKPEKIIVAVPTASGNAIRLLKPEVDQVISLYIHPPGQSFAVASSYQEWHDLTDQEVLKILKKLN